VTEWKGTKIARIHWKMVLSTIYTTIPYTPLHYSSPYSSPVIRDTPYRILVEMQLDTQRFEI